MNSLADASANLLGALCLHVNGQIRGVVSDEAGSSGMLPDAVIILKDQPGQTVEWLGRVLDMSQPGAVHLVRKLVELGWIQKRPGTDARSYALHLTPSGRRAAGRILRVRQEALEGLVALLSDEQRTHFADIASTLLSPPVQDQDSLARLCRLCDRSRCPDCPAYAAYGRCLSEPGDT